MRRSRRAPALTAAALLTGVVLAACERAERRFREAAPAASGASLVSMSDIQPGVPTPNAGVEPDAQGPYDENAYAISEGQRLYGDFNCAGCHAQGGGGSGPPLMDDEWIYGSEPENIRATIVEGRPNGMPSFRDRIPSQQLWQLVAYVRSLSGLTPMTARSTRTDHMQVKRPESLKSEERPRQ